MRYFGKMILTCATAMGLTGGTVTADPMLEQEHLFSAIRTVIINDITADLTLRESDQDGVRVILSGPKPLVTAITTVLSNDQNATLTIRNRTQTRSTGTNSSVVRSGNRVIVSSFGGSNHVVVNNGQVVINGEEQKSGSVTLEPLRITVEVAPDTAMRIEGLVGNADISDLSAPLYVSIASGDATVGQVNDAILRVDGAGSITAERVRGQLQAGISGSGHVRVKTAMLDSLQADVSGAGTIAVAGEANSATLSITGAGTISVDKVSEKPVTSIDGAGNILVGNWRR